MNPQVLRLIDANANRAREALRVLEDYARFILDDPAASAALKQLRHELAAVLAPVLPDAILCRDTAGDVGTANKTPAELRRHSPDDVVTAAGKRLGEALRAIEEYAKIDHPPAAAGIESMRYRFYDLEARLARTLRPASRLRNARLCVLITESACAGDWFETARQAIEGGADVLQLREKGLDAGELLRRAKRFAELCRSAGVISIINDRPDIAILCGADGVHVGQDDLPATEVRKLLGAGRILGVSTHRIEQARQAVLDGADYLGVGPVFPSSTKPRDILPGLEYARQVAGQIRLPAFAIAGITEQNIAQVVATGLRRIAVTAAVTRAADPRTATRRLRQKLTVVLPGATDIPVCDERAFLPAHSVSPTTSDGQECPSDTDKNVCATSTQAHRPQSTSGAIASGGTGIPACDAGDIPVPGMASGILRTRRRNLPHWELDGSTYFLTFRLGKDIPHLDAAERKLVKDHLCAGHARFYHLFAVVVLPDHVHAMLRPNPGFDVPRITKGTKGPTAHALNQLRQSKGSVWQDETYDRIMRNQQEFDEKIQYMLNNPAKLGLIDDPWLWDGWFCNV